MPPMAKERCRWRREVEGARLDSPPRPYIVHNPSWLPDARRVPIDLPLTSILQESPSHKSSRKVTFTCLAGPQALKAMRWQSKCARVGPVTSLVPRSNASPQSAAGDGAATLLATTRNRLPSVVTSYWKPPWVPGALRMWSQTATLAFLVRETASSPGQLSQIPPSSFVRAKME